MQYRSPIATNRQTPPLSSGHYRVMDIFAGELVSKSAVLAPFQSTDLGANRHGARTSVASQPKVIRLAGTVGLFRGKGLSKLSAERNRWRPNSSVSGSVSFFIAPTISLLPISLLQY